MRFARDHVADDRVQVGAGRLRRVLDAVALEDLVVRDPDAAAGARSGTAVVCGLLDDYCRESLVGRGEGGDHAGGAASDHDDVVLLSCHVEHVIELPGPARNCAGRTK